jgi:hypothetical protein
MEIFLNLLFLAILLTYQDYYVNFYIVAVVGIFVNVRDERAQPIIQYFLKLSF